MIIHHSRTIVSPLKRFLNASEVPGFGRFLSQGSTEHLDLIMASDSVVREDEENKLKVDLYFDTISPYSWPAFEVLCRYKQRWNIELTWKPVFMGGLVTGAGNTYVDNLAACPSKAMYMFKDLESRVGNFYDISLCTKADPISHIAIIGSLAQQRFVTSVLQNCADKVENVCREIWQRSWGPEDATSHTPEDLKLCAERAGLSDEQINICLSAMKDTSVKQILKQTTEEAVERGAFGAPTMFFNKGGREEMVWGSDRFEMVGSLYGLEWKGPKPQ